MPNRLRRAVSNICKNLLAFGVFCLLLITVVCMRSRNHFQKLVSEESMIDGIAVDIQIGAL